MKTKCHQVLDAIDDWKHTGKKVQAPHPNEWNIVWSTVVIFFLLHIGAIYGAYLFFTQVKWQTCVCAYILYLFTMTSVMAGGHRLWSHNSYKAKLPLRIILTTFFTMAYQYSVVEWVRIHRLHHKYCDTDADPHNVGRRFFFSHMGWLFVEEHPQVKAKTVELNDVLADPLLRFQDKYIFTLHVTSLINSVGHTWGAKPYDRNIRPVDIKLVSFLTAGEGFHNYHHTFPWDYRTAELGGYSFNFSKLFIDSMAKIGWAYDLKTIPDELIERRVKRTGDGTHPVWGWDDPDLPLEDRKLQN